VNIYVGNLPFNTDDDELRSLFEQYGSVSSAKVVIDRETDRSRGFGFVEMDDDNQAREAIAALDGQDHGGRALKINEARPREDRPRGGGGGYGGGGGGGRGGYGGGRGGGGRGGDRGDRGGW